MKLSIYDACNLVKGQLVNISNPKDILVESLSIISNEVSQGALFIAIKGKAKDGHAFVQESFERGAVAALVEDLSSLGSKPGILVSNSRLATAILSDAFWGYPSKEMVVIGVTGTNGKTTTNWILYNIMQKLYGSALRIGTLGSEFSIENKVIRSEEGNLTSPDAISTARLISDGVRIGVKSCVMEVSSIALDQFRSDGVSFDGVIFTNLTRDHLDYHLTMEQYFEAKLRLFELLSKSEKKNRVAVVNIDDPYGKEIASKLQANSNLKLVTFGRSASANIQIGETSQSTSGSRCKLIIKGESIDFIIPLIGHHNIENCVAALGFFIGIGFKLHDLVGYFVDLPQVPGRLQSVGFGGIGVYVDYAHTPDALENVIRALRPITKGRLWALFGCGGDRDRGKRPQMAHIAAKLADLVVVTSDNPRTEVPQAIIEDILASGIKAEIVECDRREAIVQTIKRAKPGDIVLIAGKGHEDYQIIGTTKYHFSDVEEVRRLNHEIS